jgi:phenylacetic acid degradation operon negative regulatory protein
VSVDTLVENPAPAADALLGSARSALITVLGDLVWPAGGEVRTSSLLSVLGELGFEERATRQAIARAATAGWIEPRKEGRSTSWSLTGKLIPAFEQGTARVASLSEPFTDWDGRWLVLMTTIPKEQRASRQRLYRRLTWSGLGSPWAGVWVTPHTERLDAVRTALLETDLRGSSLVTVGTVEPLGLTAAELVDASWQLDSLAGEYASVEEELLPAAVPDGIDLLLTRVRIRAALQHFPFRDPQLPESLAPDWIGRRVAGRLQRFVADIEPRVRVCWRDLDA